MVSRDDALVPWQNTVQLSEKSQDCRLVVLEGLGHDFPTEAPDEVISHLCEFLNEGSAAAQ